MKPLLNLLWVGLAVGVALWFYRWTAGPEIIFHEQQGVPLAAFNLTFQVGSADDPCGQEGITYLTARLLREGGLAAWERLPARTRAQTEDYLFPFAADIDVSVGKQQVSFSGISAAEEAPKIFEIVAQMMLAPAMSAEEFERLKAETLDALEKQMPREDQEELGKAALDQALYGKAHPYRHAVVGTVKGVKALTLEMVKNFYREQFTRKRLTVALGGVIVPELRARSKVFQMVPAGTAKAVDIPPAPALKGRHLTLVKGPFEATGIHLGQPLDITRAQDDFTGLYLMANAFGKHRSFVGRLMKNVREIRGLNYGTYAYVEDFPRGSRLLTEPTQAARSRQAFTVWARPTPVANGCFLLRQLLREVDSLAKDGLTAAEFELGRSHLVGNVPLLATGLERQLGYAIDARFYGIAGNYLERLQAAAKKQTRESVMAAVKKHIRPENLQIVVVTADPNKFEKEIASPKCDIQYGAGVQKPAEVLVEDAQIAVYPVNIAAENITIVEAESVYAE